MSTSGDVRTRRSGRQDGRDEDVRQVLRKQLTLELGELSPETDAQLAGASTAQLDRYLERILLADSLAAVLA